MRTLALISLIMILSGLAHAADVACYSAGKLIYRSKAQHVYYDDRALVMHDKKTGKDVFIFADCVVKI